MESEETAGKVTDEIMELRHDINILTDGMMKEKKLRLKPDEIEPDDLTHILNARRVLERLIG